MILASGKLEATSNGKTRVLGPGSIIFNAANQLHHQGGARHARLGPPSAPMRRAAPPGVGPDVFYVGQNAVGLDAPAGERE